MKSTGSSLQNSLSELIDRFERQVSQIEQKLNRIVSDRGAFENINASRSSSLFDLASHSTSNEDASSHIENNYIEGSESATIT